MLPSDWLDRDLVLLGVSARDVAGVVRAAAPALAAATGVPAGTIEDALLRATRDYNFALESGVAVPHTALDGLRRNAVAVVQLREPIDVRALDGVPADLFFVVLSRTGDPAGHLVLLAHLARISQSKVFRDGLRRATTPEEVVTLMTAAEARHATSPGAIKLSVTASQYLGVVALAGEKAVDAMLVELIDNGFDDATIFDAQSAREAASREVPLFTGFRDIFGDPGGRRLILVQLEADRVDALTAAVKRVCHDGAGGGRVVFVPIASAWSWSPPEAEPRPKGR